MLSVAALWASLALLAAAGAEDPSARCAQLTSVRPGATSPSSRVPSLTSPAFDSSAQSLDLSDCDITALPPGWLNVTHQLTQLDLHSNRIESIGAGSFSGPLTEIDISFNFADITIGSAAFAGLPDLVRLDLGASRIASLAPDFIGRSASLRELSLKQSDLTELPSGALEGLRALRKLDLSGNYLATLQADAFRGLGALRELQLQNNVIASLTPRVFKPLVSLRSLTLSNNHIEVVPDFIFAGLTSLGSVNLAGNKVRSIGPNAFQGVDLHVLDLSQNELTLAEPGADEKSPFHPLRNLQRLLLGRNSISRLSHDWLTEMPSLYELELVSNNFTELHVGTSALGDRDRDLWVDLTSNRIEYPALDDAPAIADADDPIVHFTLTDNPLVCNCALRHAARCGWNPHERRCGVRFEMGDAHCASPPALQGSWPAKAFLLMTCLEDQ